MLMKITTTPMQVLKRSYIINVFTNREIGRSKEIEHEHNRSY